jgi:site-specific recombinase XerD
MSGSSVRGGIEMTRNRERRDSLLVRGPNRKIDALLKYKNQDYPNAGANDWVLPGAKGRPIDVNRVMTHHLRPIAENLGIAGVHWHALRHLNNTIMLDENVDIASRKDRLGHTTDRVNLIYSHAGDRAQLAASEAIEKRFEAVQE